MLIIGIDPGYEKMGCAIIDKNNGSEKLIYSTCIITDRKDTHGERLLLIVKKLDEIISNFKPGAMAVEKLYFTANQKTAIKVAEARGLAIYLAAKNNISVYEFAPLEVKMAITGYGKADKNQVKEMVKAILKTDNLPKIDDEIDAIAVALALQPSAIIIKQNQQ